MTVWCQGSHDNHTELQFWHFSNASTLKCVCEKIHCCRSESLLVWMKGWCLWKTTENEMCLKSCFSAETKRLVDLSLCWHTHKQLATIVIIYQSFNINKSFKQVFLSGILSKTIQHLLAWFFSVRICCFSSCDVMITCISYGSGVVVR